jgi:hypothetical protein
MVARHYFARRGIYPVSEIELLQKGYGVTNEEAVSIVAEFIGREVIAGRGSGFGFFAMNPDTVGLLELYDESGKSLGTLIEEPGPPASVYGNGTYPIL